MPCTNAVAAINPSLPVHGSGTCRRAYQIARVANQTGDGRTWGRGHGGPDGGVWEDPLLQTRESSRNEAPKAGLERVPAGQGRPPASPNPRGFCTAIKGIFITMKGTDQGSSQADRPRIIIIKATRRTLMSGSAFPRNGHSLIPMD